MPCTWERWCGIAYYTFESEVSRGDFSVTVLATPGGGPLSVGEAVCSRARAVRHMKKRLKSPTMRQQNHTWQQDMPARAKTHRAVVTSHSPTHPSLLRLRRRLGCQGGTHNTQRLGQPSQWHDRM